MSTNIIPFGHTDFTLKRRIERACQEYERELMQRAAWMYEFADQGGCITEDDWRMFEDGSYEI